MPLIGAVDGPRAEQIIAALLAGVVAHTASRVVLDVTGVPAFDAAVAAAISSSSCTREAGRSRPNSGGQRRLSILETQKQYQKPFQAVTKQTSTGSHGMKWIPCLTRSR